MIINVSIKIINVHRYCNVVFLMRRIVFFEDDIDDSSMFSMCSPLEDDLSNTERRDQLSGMINLVVTSYDHLRHLVSCVAIMAGTTG